MVQGSSPCAPTMKKKEVTYDDTPSRKEARILWKDMGSDVVLKGGPLYDVDLVSNKDYDLEIGESSINHDDRLYRYKELRIEKRKLRYWKRKRKCHYIIFNDQLNDAMVFPNNQVRKWIEKYPVEYRYCKGLTNIHTLVKLIKIGTYQILKILKNKLRVWLSNFHSSMPMISYNIYNHILLTTTKSHNYD